MTSCKENIMFWEFSGIGAEVIGLLWNLPFLEYSTGLFFLGLFLPFIVPSGSLLLSACSCYLPTLVYLTVSCSSVSCFRVWFLTVVSVSNTQNKTLQVPGSTITLVFFYR